MKAKLIKTSFDGCANHYLKNENDVTIGSTKHPFPLEAELIAKNKGVTLLKLSLKNCQAIERGYDLDELAKNEYRNFPSKANGEAPLPRWGEDQHATKKQKAYKKGFMKALELMGDKRFSRGDVDYILNTMQIDDISFDEAIIKLQSLQQTEWDVEIVQEQGKDTFGNAELTWYNPKLDKDGCLILKLAV